MDSLRRLARRLVELDPIIHVVSLALGAIIFMYATFATIKRADELHVTAIRHTDERFQSLKEDLQEIKQTVRAMDNRFYEFVRVQHLRRGQ